VQTVSLVAVQLVVVSCVLEQTVHLLQVIESLVVEHEPPLWYSPVEHFLHEVHEEDPEAE